ncbi:MAG: 4-hydroxyphenylacetate 3-monooxygenase [Rhodospirillaceae bacterium]|nr:4-hydroxyphenylacetate 3-monooxygenase [Rhodospirillaceae bacterium]
MIRNGDTYRASLRDGRQVYLDGGIVGDVTRHPAYRNAIASAARLYEFQSQPGSAEVMTFTTPDTHQIANRIWELPQSYEQLLLRRRALEAWAELHAGFLGRSPDHVASCIAGMFMGIETFEAYDPKRARALAEYYRYARDNDLFLTYVIINPQADRSKAAHQQQGEYLSAGVVDEDASGLTVRGAKMLATSGIMANEIFVTCIQPLQRGDEKHALSFAVPMNAKGLKILSRKSYEAAADNTFDSPMSSRFDENDALIYFDDVKVPWERVFVDRSIEMCQKQFHATPAHVYQNYQAQVRLAVKARFLAGIARRIAEINGIVNMPQVREMLGQFAAEVALVSAMVAAMEAKGAMQGRYFVPDRHTLYAAQVLTQQLYGKLIMTLRELAGGGMIMLPSHVRDFANPEMAELIGKTQQSPAANARDKVKFYRLAWDVVGSEFASRHTQYEMFYAGAQFVTKGHSFRTFDWAGATGMVDRILGEYDLDGELAKLAAPPAKRAGFRIGRAPPDGAAE